MRRERYMTALGLAVQPMIPTAVLAQSSAELVPTGMAGWIFVMAVLAGTVAIGLTVWRRHRAAEVARELMAPPLIFPAAPASAVRSRPSRPPPPLVPSASGPPQFPVQTPPAAGEPAPVRSPLAGAWRGSNGGAVEAAVAPASASHSPVKGQVFDGQTIRFHIPAEGTLQLLPGRLELVAGPDSGQVIRFVKVAGESEITFGRSEGPPYRHVQLRIPTVSRKHAQMRLSGTGWSIANLSQTNPLVVNGNELAPGSDGRPLREGDRVEMGELIFVFRER
jgi:hypothetical protein